MSILQMVAVRDLAIQAYHRPFFVPHPAMAVRGFMDEVKRAESDLAKHPEDYELHSLGEFDESNGLAVPHANGVQVLVRGKDCVVPR